LGKIVPNSEGAFYLLCMSKICRQTPAALEQILQDRCRRWSTHKPDKLSSSLHLFGVTGHPTHAMHSLRQQIHIALHKEKAIYSSNLGSKQSLFRAGTFP